MANESFVTYRAIIVDMRNVEMPVAHVRYVRGIDYREAWSNGRAATNAEKRVSGKGNLRLFEDVTCEKECSLAGPEIGFVKCFDIKTRNVKIDKKALKAILENPKSSDAEKLAAMAAMVGR